MDNTDIRRKNKRQRGISIKWGIFLCLFCFTVLIVALLWIAQTVMFDGIYTKVRTNEITTGADDIVAAIGKNAEAGAVDRVAGEHDICVTVAQVAFDRETLIPLYNYHCGDGCVIHSIDRTGYRELYASARKKGGSELQRYKYDEPHGRYYSVEGDFFEGDMPEEADGLGNGVLYTVITENISGEEIVVFLNASVSPIESMVHTQRSLLAVISVVMVLLALVAAVVMSGRVASPIRRLTGSAKRLAGGDYDTAFPTTGYREARELSDALNFAQTELSRVDEVRRELIANVSHDLRTPLTMIEGYAEVMRDLPGENTPENVQVIIDEARHLTGLVNDLLDISRLESGNEQSEMTEFVLTDTVKTVLGRFARLCKSDGYLIDFICDGDAVVCADEKRIVQALYNLVGNAVNHTGEDKCITVTQKTAGGRVRISVTDTGEGIPAEKLPLIWDRYYKLDRVHKRTKIGTGLGLSIVRRVMDQNHGECGVMSCVGQGSTFYIELPLVDIRGKDEE